MEKPIPKRILNNIRINFTNIFVTIYLPPFAFLVRIGDLYSPPYVKEEVILGSLISKWDPLAVTILLFIAYNFVAISRAIMVVSTVAM